MRLVDTSAWIEWLIGSPTSDLIEAQLPERQMWLVPTVVQLELWKWLTREVGDEKADQVIAFSERCVVVALDTKLALAAAEMASQHKLAMADAIIYASAVAHGAEVLTCDAHFQHLPGVLYLEKL